MATAAQAMTAVLAVSQVLGGAKAVGRNLRNTGELAAAIRAGLPAASAAALAQRLGLTQTESAAVLGMSARTLQRRLAQGARLTPVESDRVVRVAQVLAAAIEVLADQTRAVAWLRAPNRALGGAVPLAEITTGPGATAVQQVLGRIAYGGYS
ncbi:MAG: type II RES/Xre toxin-antitoxin system antitoxin [Terriglobales bacterium]